MVVLRTLSQEKKGKISTLLRIHTYKFSTQCKYTNVTQTPVQKRVKDSGGKMANIAVVNNNSQCGVYDGKDPSDSRFMVVLHYCSDFLLLATLG